MCYIWILIILCIHITGIKDYFYLLFYFTHHFSVSLESRVLDDGFSSQCGHPGLPLGSQLVGGSLTSSEAGLWREGERVSYECAPGWRHQGPGPGRSTRECRGAARWSHHTLHCGESGPAHWTHWMRAIFNFRGESFAQPAQSSVRNIP